MRFQQDPEAKSSEKDREREREEQVATCADESRGKGMKDIRVDSENGVSHSIEQPQMRHITAGYFPFTTITFS